MFSGRIESKIIATYHTSTIHLEFKKNADKIFAEMIIEGHSSCQYPLDPSFSANHAIPSTVRSSAKKTVKWLLNNHYFPAIHDNKIVFRHKENQSLQNIPLHVAVRNGEIDVIKLLIAQGAFIDAQDSSKKTAFYLAAVQGNEEIVDYLLEHKANLTIRGMEEDTILHVVAFYGHVALLRKLLTLPQAKMLLKAQDKDGKFPLHKAVWGEPKPEIVQLLLDAGADPNAVNDYGYTPLHWAAKHGHIESARILLRSCTEIEAMACVANVNHHLPFDLAIRFEQDDFIRTFLGTKEILQVEKPSRDVEGFYSKCLVEAKVQNLIEEQILYLLKLCSIYIEKAENEIDKEKKEGFFLIGAKIVNCAIPLLDKENTLFQGYLFKKLEEIEKLFLEIQEIKATTKKDAIRNAREDLKKIRSTAEVSHHRQIPIQEILGQMTQDFKSILNGLIGNTMDLLGPPPVKWAAIGMGSMSRGEMCPYSDIEFAFLIEKEGEKALNYFRKLSKVLELKVINLGETKFPVFGGGFDSPTPDGFCMDSGGNTPLGVKGVYELIGTPKQLAQFQSIRWMDRNIILPNAMSNICIIAGDEKLEKKYHQEIKKIQELVEKREGTQRKNKEELAMRLLGGHLIEFSPDLSREKEKETAFGVKKELYRPFQEIIGCLALLYNLQERSTIGRIDELVKLNVFSTEGGENLKKAINAVLSLRLQVHLFYKDEKEFLCRPEVGKPLDPSLYYFNEQNLKALHEIYMVLFPFHKCASEFHKTKDKNSLKVNVFFDDSPTTKGKAFEKVLLFAKAQEAYQHAVSLNPNNIDAIFNLCQLEDRLGQSKDALSRSLKVLELINHLKCREDDPNLVVCFVNIGEAYTSLGLYKEALNYCLKALDMCLPVLGDTHYTIARIYNDISSLYEYLKDFDRALEYNQKALVIWLQEVGQSHHEVARTYNDTGAIFFSREDYGQALEFFKIAQKIFLQVYGENHPDTAKAYRNIGCAYQHLNDLNEAINFTERALEIELSIFGENHPSLACSYYNIGKAYLSQGNFDQALKSLQKSLKISLDKQGNPLQTALIYASIGQMYEDLCNYNKALDYHQKALAMRLQVLEENAPEMASGYNSLGDIYNINRDYEKAFNYYRMAFKIYSKEFQRSPKSFLSILNKLMFAAKKLSSPDLEEAYNICEETLGAEHYLTKEFSDLVLEFKSSDKLKILKKQLVLLENTCDKNHPDMAALYKDISDLYFLIDKLDKSLEYHQKLLTIQLETLEKNHPDIATSYHNIGLDCYLLGKYEEVPENYQKGFEIRQQILSENHLDLAISYEDMSAVYLLSEDFDKALEYIQNCLTIRSQVLGDNHPKVGESWQSLGAVYSVQEDYNKAMDCFQNCLMIFSQTLGENHVSVADSYLCISETHFKLGNDYKAMVYSIMAFEILCQDHMGGTLRGSRSSNKCFPLTRGSLAVIISSARRLPPSQRIVLGKTCSLCNFTLGTTDDYSKELMRLIHDCEQLAWISSQGKNKLKQLLMHENYDPKDI